jgi:hypothetical protein
MLGATADGPAGNQSPIMVSSGAERDSVAVIFRVPSELGCREVHLVGDLTAWAPVAMRGEPEGGFSIVMRLPRGRRWRYRFLVDGERWINDPAADDYQAAPDGGALSLLHT